MSGRLDLCTDRMRGDMGTIDLTGQVFGRLEVIGRVGVNKHGEVTWLCGSCDGKTVKVASYALRHSTRSCGCLQRANRESIGERTKLTHRIKHGHASVGNHSLTYRAWNDMLQRCGNPNKFQSLLRSQRRDRLRTLEGQELSN